MAKMMGGWHEIEGGGQPSVMIKALTGCPNNLIKLYTKEAHGGWVCMQVGDYCNGRSFAMAKNLADRGNSAEGFFNTCMEEAAAGALICCGTDTEDEHILNGLQDRHGYSLLRVAKNVAGSGLDLVQLRNPHGDGEWMGKWSDKSDTWDAYPDVKEALSPDVSDDGLFWMERADFLAVFDAVDMCLIHLRPPQ